MPKVPGLVHGTGLASAQKPPAAPALRVGGGWPANPARGKRWRWVLVGAAYGVLLRALFGLLPPMSYGPMSFAFLVGGPIAIGALSVYGTPRHALGLGTIFARSQASVCLALLGCALTLMEGAICLALMAPLFLLLSLAGGLAMGALLWLRGARPAQAQALAVMPLLLLLAEVHVPLSERRLELRQSIAIDAPPAVVWREITSARDIRKEELPLSLTHLIGVPRPLEGVNVATSDGEVRYSRWDRGVRFEGHVKEKQEARHIRWEYAFDAHSFPPGSMDEHVAIGGRHFDLEDTAFDLHEAGSGTRLEIVAHYRVSSGINFYAIPAATVLGHDFLATILGLYKLRSENAARGGRETPA